MDINSIINSIHGKDWKERLSKNEIFFPNIISNTKNPTMQSCHLINDPDNKYDLELEMEHNSYEEWCRELTLNEEEIIDARVREQGIDVLAWYVSFHTDPKNWGIYIFDFSVDYIAKKAFPTSTSSDERCYAMNVLLDHEYFHFITEMGLTILEHPSNYSINHYDHYIKKISGTYPESLANAFTYNQFKKRGGSSYLDKGLEKFMKKQPKYYSNYKLYLDKKDFQKGLRKMGNDCSCFGRNHDNNPPMEIIFDVNDNYLSIKDIPQRIVPTQRLQLTKEESFYKDLPEFKK